MLAELALHALTPAAPLARRFGLLRAVSYPQLDVYKRQIALSAASGEGVEAALRAVFAVVEEARAQEAKDEAPTQETGWHP